MASSHPPISILVPCFDDAAFLDEALASIAAQTRGDFEAIVADDASSDDSAAIAGAWAARDPRIRLLRSERNLGMTENWNRALAAASGDLVAKLDADDLWRPRTLELLSAEFGRQQNLLAAFCRVEVAAGGESSCALWQGEQALRAAGFAPEEAHVARGRVFWLLSLADVQLWHSNAFLAPRRELASLGGFDERWSCASDTAVLLRLLAENRPVAHVPYPGVVYRRRAGSVSAQFEEHGWKALEALLVRLDALARDGGRLSPLPRAARQAWWQAWRSLKQLTLREEIWHDMPERLRHKLERNLASVVPPPLAVRLAGWARLQLWRIRGRSASRSVATGPA
jgi:glycosyltransferase involved in cell wall biosynthesis